MTRLHIESGIGGFGQSKEAPKNSTILSQKCAHALLMGKSVTFQAASHPLFFLPGRPAWGGSDDTPLNSGLWLNCFQQLPSKTGVNTFRSFRGDTTR